MHLRERVSKLLVSFLDIILGFLSGDARMQAFVVVCFFFLLSSSVTVSKGMEL